MESKRFIFASVLALSLGLGVGSARAEDPQWTLATDDTSLTLSLSSNRLLVTSLMNPARGWNWIAAPTGFPLVATANSLPLTWQYTNATYSTSDGQKLTLRFECASPALVLISEWWARPGRGPVRHAMTITNLSGGTATISYQPSLYLPVDGDGPLSAWYIHADGATPDATGLYNDTVSGSYSTNLETRSEGFFIPFAALTVTNGHGVYIGTEWSAARTYIQGGSTTSALLEATGYQEGRAFTYALTNNATFVVPPAFVGAYAGDRDAAGNGLRKYLWDYSMPSVIRTNSAYPTVQWNAYYAMSKNTPYVYDTVQTKWAPFVDQIAPLGFEEIMHDVGWNATMTSPLYDAVDWPFGMKVSFDYAKSKGLRCGLYLAGPQTYANIKYLFDTYGAQSWRSDGTAGYALGSSTATTYAEVLSFYQMLDALQADVPGFEFENCNGGGRIKDFGAMKRSTKIFYTDTYTLLDSQQTFYDSSHVFPAVQLLSSLIDRPVGVAGTVYAWRTAALGAPGGFGDSPAGLNGEWTMVFSTPPRTHHGGVVWTAAEKQAVAATLAVYKNRVRPLQRDSELYHLTTRPDGTQWYAIQYFKPTLKQGVAYIFRPDSSSATQHFTLKGLNAASEYVVTFADGSNPTTIRTGAALMSTGIDVTLANKTNSDWMLIAEGAALTQPAEATVYNAPGTIPLEAVAAPTNGSISRVEFYAGSNLLQTVTTAASGTVYACVASNVAAGTYLLTAKVYTNGTLTAVSAPVGVRVNALPIANTNDYIVVKNTMLTVTTPGVLDNDSDPDGDALTAVSASNPLHGSVTLNTDGSFSYTPTNNYSGPDAFTYQVTDGWATSTPTTVTITVLPTGALGTGGTVVSYTDEGGTNWTAHTFTNAGTNTLTFSAPGVVEYLIVGGGGGGGNGSGGGGGGGGGIVKTGTLQVVVGDYQVVVGNGGAAGGGNGSTSSISTVTACGGGGGGTGGAGANYGNGGGGAGAWGSSGNTGYAGGAGTDGGKTGGKGFDNGGGWNKCGGGGAGMGTNGAAASNTKGGDGGAGIASAISGVSTNYGGGGGGGQDTGGGGTQGIGLGGSGGGGNGGSRSGTSISATPGTDGLGGGGGGGGGGLDSAKGGSGIVIVRYLTSASEAAPSFIENRSVTSVTTNSATFNGMLTSTGSAAMAVCVLWGETTNVWANTNWWNGGNPDPTLTNNTPFCTNITSGILPDKTYYYTFAATNASTNVVAAAPVSFMTGTLTVQATDPMGRTTNGDPVVFTVYRSASCTNASMSVNYTLAGTAAQGADYSIAPASGAATFAPGATNVAITVTPVYKVDSQKTVVLSLAAGAYALGAMNSTTGTLAAVELSVSAQQMKITFGGYTNRSETLTNFPVLVTLSNNVGGSGFRYDDFLSTNGYDLRFVTNLTDATSLNYEIEAWNTNGASYVWVQVPTLPGDGSGAIWATWGNAVTSNRLACTTNGATWDATFAAVWHLQSGTMLAVRDSTTNAYAGTSSNNPVSATGKIGGAGDFDGGNPNGAYVTTGFNPSNSLGNKFMVRAWVYPRATGNYKGVAGSHGLPNYCGIEFLQWITDHWDANVGNGTAWATNSASVPLVVSNWNDVAVVWSSDGAGSALTTTAYVDGSQKDLKTTSSFGNIAHVSDFKIGRANYAADRCFNGMIDELRVSRVARSANWVWAENQSMASNTVFNKYGAMQTPGNVPAAPTGLTATAAATNRIELAWSDNASNETGYVVYRSLDSNAWVLVVVTSVNATNTSDSGLTTNTLYYYRVAASNTAGLSAYCFATGMTWSAYEAWRQTQFDAVSLTNAAVSGDTADPDHDGLNNQQEFWAGTDPTNGASVLVLAMPTAAPGGANGFVVSWQSASNKFYTLQAATNWAAPGFTNVVTNIMATAPLNVYTDNVGGAGQKFYRVKVE